jgi:acyl transferase domain-containing protein
MLVSVSSARNSYDDMPWSYEQPRFISPVTGAFHQSRSRLDLLRQVLFDVLTKPILWENVLQSFSSHVVTLGYSECTIRPFGPTYAARSLASTLEKQTGVPIMYDNSFASSNPSQGTRARVTWGLRPAVVVGHSLGEYAALYASGVLSASDTPYLVGKRATLLEASCIRGTHSMLAINASEATLRKSLGAKLEVLEITCRNGPDEIVLGGPDSQVQEVKEYLNSRGVRCTVLAIPYASQSSQVEPLLDLFEEAAAGVVYSKPICPLASPLLGSIVRDSGTIGPGYLRRHARETVDFHQATGAIDKDGLCDEDTIWLELGSSAVCLGMIKSILGPQIEGACVLKVREDPWTTACRALSLLYTHGLAVNWSEYHRDFEPGQQLLHLPSYEFEETNYFIEYKGDWALRKGGDLANAPIASSAPARSGPGTDSVQRLMSQDIVHGKSVRVFETDLSDPALHHMIAGHVMNGVSLCPAVSCPRIKV